MRRVIGPLGALSIVAGSMLGVGIFVSPPVVAQLLPSSWAFFGVWFLGGVFALAGASAYAELGARHPHAGGDYVFVREALGPSAGFATGFMLFTCVFAGSIATVASILATEHLPGLLRVFGVTLPTAIALPSGVSIELGRVLGLALIWLLTAINLRGAKTAALLQVWTTAIPLVAMLSLAAFAITSGAASPGAPTEAAGPITASAVGKALVTIYFAYSGWNAIAYVGGEVVRPERTLPWGLLGGTALITALYLVVCSAYTAVLGLPGLASVADAGIATAAHLGGQATRVVITALIVVTLLGSLNGTVLAGGRIAVAMRPGGHQEGPQRPLLLQAGIASLLLLTGSFELLLELTSIAMLVIGTLAVVSLFVLRRRFGAPATYRALGYPWLPATYLVLALFVVGVCIDGSVTAVRTEHDTLKAALPLLGLLVFAASFFGHRMLLARRRFSDAIGAEGVGLAAENVGPSVGE
ncbi:MAG: amino acid permease [Polyangiales bacterium]|nr:amino acid permease [Myxococcales bacterium]MCB9657879.1 amino acid permease [Sandaracinaceae bacterium]